MLLDHDVKGKRRAWLESCRDISVVDADCGLPLQLHSNLILLFHHHESCPQGRQASSPVCFWPKYSMTRSPNPGTEYFSIDSPQCLLAHRCLRVSKIAPRDASKIPVHSQNDLCRPTPTERTTEIRLIIVRDEMDLESAKVDITSHHLRSILAPMKLIGLNDCFFDAS